MTFSSGERRRGERGGRRHEDGLELVDSGICGQEGIQRDLRSEQERERERPPLAAAGTPPVFCAVVVERLRSPSAEETLNFWKGIADVGLLGEVVPNISAELLELLNSVKQRNEAAAGQETGAEPSRAAVC